ncbi:MAG: hypothetical protein IT536_11335 [Hyphomicrobiales bacterium]|nr:hypothetical protein [Hyphomicrobiales bacterium]
MLRARTAILVFALGVAVAAFVAKDAVTVGLRAPENPPENAPKNADAPAHSAFVEVKWPFPRDMWGEGRAFRCAAADCGVEVHLSLRPKIGFCNCDTGVADEAELDRIGDLELYGPTFIGLTHADDIVIGGMRGLSRIYQVDVADAVPRPMLGMAFSSRCDVMAVTVVAPLEQLPSAERQVLAFLNGEPMLRWAKMQFGL